MVVDAQGRAYVGNFGFDLMARRPAGAGRAAPGRPRRAASPRSPTTCGSPTAASITADNVLLVVRDVRQPRQRLRPDRRRRAGQPADRGRSSGRCRPTADVAAGARPAAGRRRRRLPRRGGRAVDRRRHRRPAHPGASRAARSPTRSSPAHRCTRARSAAPPARRCSPAPRPTSTRRPVRRRARPACSPCGWPYQGADGPPAGPAARIRAGRCGRAVQPRLRRALDAAASRTLEKRHR